MIKFLSADRNFQSSVGAAASAILLWSAVFAAGGCANKVPKSEAMASASNDSANTAASDSSKSVGKGDGTLICKARKSKFKYDWQAVSPAAGDGRIDQNSVSFDFRAATRPAGFHGENLKVGECGWAESPMSSSKKETSSVVYKRLSDEATETFYKLRTGKVFKLPVRQGKNGLSALPGAPVTVVR